jgi:chromosome segregation protein
VELVFDNADHRAGGQWSQFTEIAVKRVLTRDGTSSYYINNQPVRRRDVQDVFLGTGLGPRAYAIIGQGTISRIIESRPRSCACSWKKPPASPSTRSAAARPKTACPTRARTSRVEDILRELNNLDKLESRPRWPSSTKPAGVGAAQAAPAVVLKRAEADEARAGSSRTEAVNDLEARMADLRHVEAELETIRQAHYAAGDRSTRRRAGCTRPAPRSAGWRPRSASWSKAASAPSSAWCS